MANEPTPKINRPERPSDAKDKSADFQVIARSWQGPIPPPSDLSAYNDIIPNGAERLFAQFEKETEHRHKLQTREQTFPLIEQLAGRTFALLFALACLGLSAYAISVGAQLAAVAFGGLMIVAGINAFVRRGTDIHTPKPPSIQSKPATNKKKN